MKFIYLILSIETGSLKIGISKNPKKRIVQLQTGSSGSELKLLKVYKSSYYLEIENALHNKYVYLKKHGEWFDYDLEMIEHFEDDCKKYENSICFLKKNNNYFL